MLVERNVLKGLFNRKIILVNRRIRLKMARGEAGRKISAEMIWRSMGRKSLSTP
jgi:hypothetical protein